MKAAPPSVPPDVSVVIPMLDESAIAEQTPHFQRVMGTHRSVEHLSECYLMGTTDEVTERLQDLVDAGCSYLCVGPTAADPEPGLP